MGYHVTSPYLREERDKRNSIKKKVIHFTVLSLFFSFSFFFFSLCFSFYPPFFFTLWRILFLFLFFVLPNFHHRGRQFLFSFFLSLSLSLSLSSSIRVLNNVQRYRASWPVNEIAINSASHIDKATEFCFLDFHEIIGLFYATLKQNLLTLFLSLKLAQSASQNFWNFKGFCDFLNISDLLVVPFK